MITTGKGISLQLFLLGMATENDEIIWQGNEKDGWGCVFDGKNIHFSFPTITSEEDRKRCFEAIEMRRMILDQKTRLASKSV